MSLVAQYKVLHGDNNWSRHRVPEALLVNSLDHESLKPSSDWQSSPFYNVTAVHKASVVSEHSWDLTIYINGNYCTFVWTSCLTLRHNSKLFVHNFYLNLWFVFLFFLEKSIMQSWQNLMIIKKLKCFLHPENVSAWKQVENCRTFRNPILSIMLGIFFQKRDQTLFWNVERKNQVVWEVFPLEEPKKKFRSFILGFNINNKDPNSRYELYWNTVEAKNLENVAL